MINLEVSILLARSETELFISYVIFTPHDTFTPNNILLPLTLLPQIFLQVYFLNFYAKLGLPVCGGERATGLRSAALRAMIAAMEKSVARVLPSSATILSPDLQHSAPSTSMKHFNAVTSDICPFYRVRPTQCFGFNADMVSVIRFLLTDIIYRDKNYYFEIVLGRYFFTS